jgi:N-methylhydantoinase A
MEEAIKAISTMRGYDLRDFMLVAFGGAGPLHSSQMARDLGMKGVIVPLYPGVNSAIGLLQADVKHDYAASRLAFIDVLTPEDANRQFGGLAAQAAQDLRNEGFDDDQVAFEHAVDMRYAGQGYELTIPVPSGTLDRLTLDGVRVDFDETHKRLFGHSAPEELVEVVTYRVTGIGRVPEAHMPTFKATGARLEDAYRETRAAHFSGETLQTPVYQRERLDVGHVIKGPALVEQLDATLVIPPGQVAKVDGYKNIIITEEG